MTTPMDVLLDAVDWQETGDPEDVAMADDGIPWVTHSGVLNIGPAKFRCYQLNDGTRILDAEDVEAFFGLSSSVD